MENTDFTEIKKRLDNIYSGVSAKNSKIVRLEKEIISLKSQNLTLQQKNIDLQKLNIFPSSS